MRFVVSLVVMMVFLWAGEISCGENVNSVNDLNSVIDIVYNPSAGPFQDTSEAFYNPSLIGKNYTRKEGKSEVTISNNIFPDRLEIRNNLTNYGQRQHKLSFTPQRAKLLRNGKKD